MRGQGRTENKRWKESAFRRSAGTNLKRGESEQLLLLLRIYPCGAGLHAYGGSLTVTVYTKTSVKRDSDI